MDIVCCMIMNGIGIGLLIKGNEIKELPPELGSLDYLEKIDMSENMIAAIPWEVGFMASLRHIEVAQNPLLIPPTTEVQKGTDAMLKWLRDNEKAGRSGAKVGLSGLEQQQ